MARMMKAIHTGRYAHIPSALILVESLTRTRQLSNKRRIGVSQFKKMSFINIREYYDKDGKTLPGKKVSC
jgi:hypothetical protein